MPMLAMSALLMTLATNANAHHVSPINDNNASTFFFFFFTFFFLNTNYVLKIVTNLLKDDASHDDNAGHASAWLVLLFTIIYFFVEY